MNDCMQVDTDVGAIGARKPALPSVMKRYNSQGERYLGSGTTVRHGYRNKLLRIGACGLRAWKHEDLYSDLGVMSRL